MGLDYFDDPVYTILSGRTSDGTVQRLFSFNRCQSGGCAMNIGDAARKPENISSAASRSRQWKILGYIGILVALIAVGTPNGGFVGIPLVFILKNKLHLNPQQVADFRLFVGAPLYLSFLFGLARDRFDPFGLADRGFIILFGGICAGLYLAFSFAPANYAMLLVGMLLLRIAFQFVVSAQGGLSAALGRQHLMSGQISAAWNIFLSSWSIVGLLAGGLLSQYLESQSPDHAIRILFLAGAAIMCGITGYGMLRPGSVFDQLTIERNIAAKPRDAIRKLSRHRALVSALAIWLLWSFSPGSDTALVYYMQNTLHGTDLDWGQWNAIFTASFIPSFAIFGFLCRRYSLRSVLRWGSLVAVPQFVPMLFIHSLPGMLMAAVLMGLMGGVATAAYLDLIIRSAPKTFQGTTLMMAGSIAAIASRFGDVLGTLVYNHYQGFAACVMAITIAHALILPVLAAVPKALISSSDGQHPEENGEGSAVLALDEPRG